MAEKLKLDFFMGAASGYNAQPTKEEMLNQETKVYELLKDLDGIIEKPFAAEGRVVYAKEFGCPDGGEKGRYVFFELEEKNLEKVLEKIKDLSVDLGQSTVTVKVDNELHYFQNKYKENEPQGRESYLESNISVTKGSDRAERTFDEKLDYLSENFQKAVSEQLKEQQADPSQYIISGMVIERTGNKTEVIADRNPNYGQEEPEKFRATFNKEMDRTEELNKERKLDKNRPGEPEPGEK